MRKSKGRLTKKIQDDAVALVIRTIKDNIGTDPESRVEFVQDNKKKVSNAYFEAARRHGVRVSWDDTSTGYNLIVQGLEKAQEIYDKSFVTGFGQSGRNYLRV